jgi:hypothetical protein
VTYRVLAGAGIGFSQGDVKKLVTEDIPLLKPTLMAGINCTIIWHHVLHIKCKNVGICISCVCVSRAIWSVSDDLAILLQELVQMLIYFATGVPRVYSRFYDKIMQGIEKKGRFAK